MVNGSATRFATKKFRRFEFFSEDFVPFKNCRHSKEAISTRPVSPIVFVASNVTGLFINMFSSDCRTYEYLLGTLYYGHEMNQELVES